VLHHAVCFVEEMGCTSMAQKETSVLRGVKRVGKFWMPQIRHLLRQASAGLFLVLIGVKLGLAHSDFFNSRFVAPFLYDYILGCYLVNRFLASWGTRRPSVTGRGFEVIQRDVRNESPLR
jgi:hypothetical protein